MRGGGDELRVHERFCGPPDSANGGYISGLLAGYLGGEARVTLRAPPPLSRPLRVAPTRHAGLTLLDGGVTVAEAERVRFSPEVPTSVTFTDAVAASDRYRWKTGHPYPTCFVCGTARDGDALRIFAGLVPGRDIVAAPWVPEADVCGTDGRVLTEVVWAALDCPSGYGSIAHEPDVSAILLGQLTAVVYRSPREGEQCVVIGWSRGHDGRKRLGGAALFSEAGELYGASEAVWIIPKAG